jgi:hypothetical protein
MIRSWRRVVEERRAFNGSLVRKITREWAEVNGKTNETV